MRSYSFGAAIGLLITLFTPVCWSADNLDKLFRDGLDPKYFEHLNCKDGSLSQIVPELSKMSVGLTSILKNDQGKRRVEELMIQTMLNLGGEAERFCKRQPNGTYNEFSEYMWGKWEKISDKIDRGTGVSTKQETKEELRLQREKEKLDDEFLKMSKDFLKSKGKLEDEFLKMSKDFLKSNGR